MKVLVDTSVWSLALRRRRGVAGNVVRQPEVQLLAQLIANRRVVICGPIRQELLSGVRLRPQYERLREVLRSFPDLAINTEDYERAAEFYNRCRAKGIQGSAIDFFICSVAVGYKCSVFTIDRDFLRYRQVLPLTLFEMQA